jgi:flavin-dependent dehydrogenase
VGIAGVLHSPDPDPAAGHFSLVEAVPGGWWYSAPLPGGGLAVVYMTDADLQGSRLARTAEGWHRLLRGAGHTSRRVADGRYRGPERLRRVTATTSRLVCCAGEGWAAIGDAAATFDPLSSHGIYTALAGGFQVGRAIAWALSGDPAELRAYPAAVDRAFREYLALRLRGLEDQVSVAHQRCGLGRSGRWAS